MFTMLVWLGSHLPAGANLLLYSVQVYNMAVRPNKCLVWFSPPSWRQSAPVGVQHGGPAH